MADTLSKEKRSELMSKIRGKGNRTTELRLISIMRSMRISGWRRNYPLFGKPDFVFPRMGLAVFVDGCFWHACPDHCKVPKSNREFWIAKLEKNASRDELVTRTLKASGWEVVRIWEHDLRGCDHEHIAAALAKETTQKSCVGF